MRGGSLDLTLCMWHMSSCIAQPVPLFDYCCHTVTMDSWPFTVSIVYVHWTAGSFKPQVEVSKLEMVVGGAIDNEIVV